MDSLSHLNYRLPRNPNTAYNSLQMSERWYNTRLVSNSDMPKRDTCIGYCRRVQKMITKSQLVLIRYLLLSLLSISLLTGTVLAQSPTPLGLLNIALWPEYDRPEVLIIYRGQVADNVPLPAQVSFDLPSDVAVLSAVAYLDEAEGRLLNLPDYELVEAADGKRLSFATPSRQFQFEYYSDDTLSRDGDTRQIFFSFTPSAAIGNLSFELQKPTAASDFTSDPSPSETQTRQDGLTYAVYDLGAVSSGDPHSLQVSYTRGTDELSADTLVSVNVPSPAEQTPVEVGGGGLQDYLGPILITVGILLLTGSLLYWFWSQRSVVVPEPTPHPSAARTRRSSRKKEPAASRSAASPTKEHKIAAYCHHCGTKYREDASFCHACGAERRA